MEIQNLLVNETAPSEQATFYRKTYLHVALALLAFIVVETLLLLIIPENVIASMLDSRMIWLFILGLFWLGSTFSNNMAFSESKQTQYLGLGFYVILEALIFMPMIYMALAVAGGDILIQAGSITLFMFAGLSAVVFFTKSDFSFLRTAITIGGFISLGIIVIGAIFGFNLGLWFSVGMVMLASGSILYQTGQIKNTFGTHQYVGAALQLFASIMLLFWYVLRILLSRK
jgi:FtsH-binding integral membrane protein